jgi:hypothetical protein
MTNLVRARGITAVSQSVQGSKRGLSIHQASDDLRYLGSLSADMVALQGMSRFRDWSAFRRSWDWHSHDVWPRFAWDKGHSDPIIWSTERFDFVDGHTRLLHEAVHGMTPARYMNLVLLRDRQSGLMFWVRNTEYIESFMHHKELDKKRIETWLNGNANDRLYLREAMQDGLPVLSFGLYHRMHYAVVGTYVNDHKVIYAGRRQSDYSILNSNTKGGWYIQGIEELPWEQFNSQHTGRLLRLNLNRVASKEPVA